MNRCVGPRDARKSHTGGSTNTLRGGRSMTQTLYTSHALAQSTWCQSQWNSGRIVAAMSDADHGQAVVASIQTGEEAPTH